MTHSHQMPHRAANETRADWLERLLDWTMEELDAEERKAREQRISQDPLSSLVIQFEPGHEPDGIMAIEQAAAVVYGPRP